MSALYSVFYAAQLFLQVLSYAILFQCILSWIAPRSPLYGWLEHFTSPFVAPFRRLTYAMMRRWGSPFDFSCWFAMIAINILSRLLWRLYYVLLRLF